MQNDLCLCMYVYCFNCFNNISRFNDAIVEVVSLSLSIHAIMMNTEASAILRFPFFFLRHLLYPRFGLLAPIAGKISVILTLTCHSMLIS